MTGARLVRLPEGSEILLHRDRRRGRVPHRRRDLARQLAAHIARGEETRDGRHHPVVGDEVAACVVLRVPVDEAGIGLEPHEDEYPTTGSSTR